MYTVHVYMMYSMVTCNASVAMVAVVAVMAVAVAPHGQSDGHGHDHSLAMISRPGHQFIFSLHVLKSKVLTNIKEVCTK